MRDIDGAMTHIEHLWQFDAAHYPPVGLHGPDGVRHVVLHMMKDVGKMAAAVEPLDHDHSIAYDDKLYRPARNMLINVLRLCALLDLKPSFLIADYESEQ